MILQWLLPLGFLGLAGIGVLAVIYILRPKYTRRVLPSTFMWIRSQKYRRKRMPIEPFRDWLIFLLQALAIAACAIIIASPRLVSEELINESNERVVVIDASASMRSKLVKTTGETRFKRAIDQTKLLVDEVLIRQGGSISVILAGKTPEFIVDDADRHSYSDVIEILEQAECTYGSSDLEAAMLMAEDRVLHNPAAKVTVFSGTELGYMGDAVTFVNLSDSDKEWNIGICNCNASYEQNQYVFYLDVAAYGKVSMDAMLHVEIKGIDNGDGAFDLDPLDVPVSFNVNENGEELVQHVNLIVDPTNEEIGGSLENVVGSFEEVLVQFRGLNDSLPDDDTLMVYGGQRDRVAIEHYVVEDNRNIFFASGIRSLVQRFEKTRDVMFTSTIDEEYAKSSGSDIYMYEHVVPEKIAEMGQNGLPNDGITVLLDPNEEAMREIGPGLGLQFKEHKQLGTFTHLTYGPPHMLTNRVSVEELGISAYDLYEAAPDSGFVPVLYCGDDPVLFARNWHASKIVVMAFSINMSNFPTRPQDFLFLLCNMIDFYMPVTLSQYCFEIGEKATVNCKGSSLLVTNMRGETVSLLTEFPNEVPLDEIGTYTFTTRFSLNKPDEVRKAYVRTPVIESSLFRIEDLNFRIMNSDYIKEMGKDIFFWFAVLAVVLLFVEYWVQHRDIIGGR